MYRGKGDNHRLGHGTEEHVRFPKQITAFASKKVVEVAVGTVHTLAITEDGKVYGWGRNGQGQLGENLPAVVPEPVPLGAVDGKTIIGAACGVSLVSTSVYSPSKYFIHQVILVPHQLELCMVVYKPLDSQSEIAVCHGRV